MSKIKLMTYNIHSGFGRDKLYRLDRIINVIKSEAPDIVTLQEVDNRLSRSNYQNQSQIIADELGMSYHHCVNHYPDGGEYGITTLSRLPIKNVQRYDLSFRKRYEPRGCLQTDLRISHEQHLHVFNLHLGLRILERQYQLSRLLQDAVLLNGKLEAPVLVSGDFNDRPVSVVHKKLQLYFTDACNEFGTNIFPTFKRGPIRFRLDHIYFNKNLTALEARVINTPLARIASDHLPVIARFEAAYKRS